MIANQTFGGGFVGLGSYLREGKNHVYPSLRVGWTEFRNLPTSRMDIAERIMAGTASLSYTKKPVFHLSISFAPGDLVDEALMRRVMARTLSDIGLAEHQAVIVAHIDTDDPHVHAMVNRVHPETGVAWKGSWSRLRVEASLRQQELDEGLRVVPGWLARVPGHPEMRPRPRLARADEEFLREVQERAGPVLERAESWFDVEAGLVQLGLSVRMNGRGMSVTDGQREVKASEIGRQFSRFQLEKRLGRFSDYQALLGVARRTLWQARTRVRRDTGRMRADASPSASQPAAGPCERFSLYEEDGGFAVWDSAGPNLFFAETRERAEVEMQRANRLVARYPNIRVVRCLRDMDGEWHDARGLPRPREEKGRPLRRRALPAWAEPSTPIPAPTDLGPAARSPEAPPRLSHPVAASEITVQPSAAAITAGSEQPAAPGAERSNPALESAPVPVREDASFLDEVRSHAKAILRVSPSWAELEHDLAELGLFLRVKGGGFVVTDGQREVKASEVSREFSRFYLEKRLGRYPGHHLAAAASDVASAPPASAVQADIPAQQVELPKRQAPAAAPQEPKSPTISVSRPFSVPAEVEPAAVAPAGTAANDEIFAPAPIVERAAAQVGALEPAPPAEPIREEVTIQHQGPQPEAHRTPDLSAHGGGPEGGEVPDEGRLNLPPRMVERAQADPAVEEAVRAFVAWEEAHAAHALARTLREERAQAEQVLAKLDRQDRELERTRRDFRATAARVYRNPAAAIAAWDELVLSETDNLKSAAEKVTKKPEILGPLLTDPHPSALEWAAEKLGFPSTREAREAVPRMLDRAVLHTPALREATKPVEWTAPDGQKVEGRKQVRSMATEVVRDRQARIKSLDEKVQELGGLSGTERDTQLAFYNLSPAQRSQAERKIAAWGAANGVTEAAVATKLAEVLRKAHRAASVARSAGKGPVGFNPA
ncbi:MAG TPA: relaxase/mobilization nuclease domain-containing protein [Longimicrobium sp.]|nr:relaxase/mobilization nuclease domain-containing protein [Longimicrobium sp.]